MKEAKLAQEVPKNALVHGFYVSELTLPWESREDLKHLHRALTAEWAPETPTQEEAVLILTGWLWKKRRVQRASQIVALREPFAQEIADSGKKTWSQIRKFLKERAADDLNLLVPKRFSLNGLIATFEAASKQMMSGDLDKKARDEIMNYLHRLHGMMQKVVNFREGLGSLSGPQSTFEAAYNPNDLERVAQIESMIDSKIDQSIARLVSLKEYQRLSAQRKSSRSERPLLSHKRSEED